jgi:hypothetical protein
MSKIVARMQKMKIGNLGGIQRHNQRENENHSNKEIDVGRSHLNYDLVNQKAINYQKHIKEIIDSQRTSTRAVRKDAVLVNEWIITSDQNFFETTDFKAFFEDSLAYFSERCGAQNIAYAMVHLDETTPHMHLGIVPMANNRLSSKQVFTRQALKEIQDELPAYLKERGHEIERGIKGSERKHLTVEEYKENQRAIENFSEELDMMRYEAEVKENVVTHELQAVWNEDWLETKRVLPDFEMTIALEDYSDAFSGVVSVDEETPRDYFFLIDSVLKLIKEKFQKVKAYISELTSNLTSKASELQESINTLESDKNVLEDKLERLKEGSAWRVKENSELGQLVEEKTRYVEQLARESELSMKMPAYVKQSKLNKDVLLVPREKWEAKHVAANTVNEMLRIQNTFGENVNLFNERNKLKKQNIELRKKLDQLEQEAYEDKLGYIKFWNVFGKMINHSVMPVNMAKQLDLPDAFREEFRLIDTPKATKKAKTKEIDREIGGPSL